VLYPWLAVGWRSADDISFELAPRLKRKNINLIVGEATQIITLKPQWTLWLRSDGKGTGTLYIPMQSWRSSYYP
jgi:hypothetical protein